MNRRSFSAAAGILAVFAGMTQAPVAQAAASPSAPCTSGLTRLDLRAGDGIPLPSRFSNPTASTVTFTVRMRSSHFFGPPRDVQKVTLPPFTGRTSGAVVLTHLHTPLGGGPVVIDVRTNGTGDLVVGRCDYQLHLAPVVPTGTGVLGAALPWTYQVPVQMCAMEGSSVAGAARPGSTVAAGTMLTALAAADKDIWHTQAQIAFSTATDHVIPVIADPTPPPVYTGPLGVVDTFPADGQQIADLCTAAWATRFPGRRGIPVVAVKAFHDLPDTHGVAPKPARGLQVASHQPLSGTRGDALCGSPVGLLSSDIVKPFVMMSDSGWSSTIAARLLAHELGHNLFLAHGNGLDDNGDGRPAGMTGSRRYDEYCDPGWLQAPSYTELAEEIGVADRCSLMHRTSCNDVMRPLQRETARGVARYLPGFVDGTPTMVVDSGIAP